VYLTREEERILNGECGWANQTCMKILTRLGDLYDAEKLIPISSAHISGVSYKTLGDAPVEFLRALADSGAEVKVRTTLNPQSLDAEHLAKRLPKTLAQKQLNILRQFERMGTTKSLTCTPYYMEKPKGGSHLAWAESSAVVYANSVLGAWTNREGGPSALAAAIMGKTPDHGMHRAENRQANLLVNIETRMQSETDFGALGIHLGKMLEDRIPIIRGLGKPSRERLKQLSAALATTGMTNMFHYNTCSETKRIEKITVEAKDLRRTVKELSTGSCEKCDLVFIGCPHCSLYEIKQIAQAVRGKKVKGGTEFWVCTSSHIKDVARDYVKEMERSGGQVLAGVCTVVSWTEKLGIESIMTNSAKTAYYAPTLNKAETILSPMKECLRTAFQG
jgi:predicted aconitase